jgi:hypothetical protein
MNPARCSACKGSCDPCRLRQLLGILTRFELDGFLKEHGINDGMTLEEFARDSEELDRLGV